MPQNVGQLAEATHYNTVAEDVNLVFGDKYPSAAVTDVNRKDTHKYGWGAINVTDNLSPGTLITAERLQDLVERTNVSINHIDVTDSVLVFATPVNRTDVTAQTPIRAEDLNLIEDKFTNTILVNNNHATVDPADASALPATPTSGGPYTRSALWDNRLIGEHVWSWNSYNDARYFFNGGGQVRLALEMTNGSTAGYYNWADVINEMGVLNMTWDNFFQSNSITLGTSEGKGFYDLTEYFGDGSDAGTPDEGLLFTSSGVTLSRQVGTYGYGYGYGTAYGYIQGPGTWYQWADPAIIGGTYSNSVYASAYSIYSSYQQLKFRIYGKYANNGADVHLKFILDDSQHYNFIDGSIAASCSYLMPDVITQGGATFDVSPDPVLTILDNLTSPNDF
jgi:hypothetical protein